MARSSVTVIDLARAAGVSKSTVSLVLQGSTRVHEETRVKVNKAIKELGYVYNRSAANLRQAKSGIVGVVVNDLTNGFFAELAVGVDLVLQSAGYVQFLSHAGESVDRQTEVIASMREHGIAGLILSAARGTEPNDLRYIVDSGIPVVLAVRNVPGAKTSTVMSDNYAGTRLAARHLIELGHRRIGFVGGFEDTAVFHERLGGYRDALIEAGLPVDPACIINSAPSRAGGMDVAERVLTIPDRPTGTLCLNDAVAFGVCDGLRRAGVEPGRDFAVIGFDDVIEAKSAVPALTTVSVDPQGMGRRAAQLLLKQINSGSADIETVTSPVRLVIRQSCGGAALRNAKEASA